MNVRSQYLSLGRMAAYSIDLRQKILRAWERHLGAQRAIADSFGVSLAVVEKVLGQHRTTGKIAPKPHAGGQTPRLGVAAEAVVQRLRGANPDATLEELCTRVAAETGGAGQCADDVPRAAAPGPTPSNKSLHASERETPRLQHCGSDEDGQPCRGIRLVQLLRLSLTVICKAL